jgi:hypothetical protein
MIKLLFREWDRFAKAEYERLAMEEEGGDDSEMIDAMEGWDSEDNNDDQAEGTGSKEKKTTKQTGATVDAT